MEASQSVLPDSEELVDIHFYGAGRVMMKCTYSPAILTTATVDILGLALKSELMCGSSLNTTARLRRNSALAPQPMEAPV
jgi:hypothetical protein